jgi:hypothetical protein
MTSLQNPEARAWRTRSSSHFHRPQVAAEKRANFSKDSGSGPRKLACTVVGIQFNSEPILSFDAWLSSVSRRQFNGGMKSIIGNMNILRGLRYYN